MKSIVISVNIISMFFCFSQIFAEIYEVDNNKIVKLINEGVPIIDIRTKIEWEQTGIINKSKTITFFDKDGNFDEKKWLSKLKGIARKNDPLIIICRSGRRSRIVANFLNLNAGYTTIYHATDGILSWMNENRKTILPN